LFVNNLHYCHVVGIKHDFSIFQSRLVIAALTYNIVFRAKHIKGKTNVIADYLSRSQFQKARALAPWLVGGTFTISSGESPPFDLFHNTRN
jgi:hypothetical protein